MAGNSSCRSCGKFAPYDVGGIPICIDCNLKIRQAQSLEVGRLAAIGKMIECDLFDVSGISVVTGGGEMNSASSGSINYNNQVVHIHGDNVGVVNVGNVQEIERESQNLRIGGSESLADAIDRLKDLISEANEVRVIERDELLERLSFLAAQAASSPANRKLGLVKSVFGALKDGLAVVAGATDVWQALEPILVQHFGVGAD